MTLHRNIANRVFNTLQYHSEEINNLLKVNNSYVDFTNKIKFLLAELGEKEFGLETATQSSSQNFSEGEWFFDLVWFEMNEEINKIGCLKSINLVLECEISAKDFKGFKIDFDKLFFVKDAVKIMIFSKLKNSSLMKDIIDYGQKSINSFDNFKKGDGIYLILFDEYFEGNFNLIPLIKK